MWFRKRKKPKPVEPLPEPFEPFKNNRWVLQLENIDAFLLKRIDLPTFHKNNPNRGIMRVELHNVIGIDSNGPLLERLGAEPTTGVLKLLDMVGTIMEMWTFEEMELIEVGWNPLDYGDASPMITVARFEVSIPEISPTVPSRRSEKSARRACSTHER